MFVYLLKAQVVRSAWRCANRHATSVVRKHHGGIVTRPDAPDVAPGPASSPWCGAGGQWDGHRPASRMCVDSSWTSRP